MIKKKSPSPCHCFSPFTHELGQRVFLPSTYFSLRVYPTRLLLLDLKQEKENILACLDWHIKGPFREFTLKLNLIKNNIHVSLLSNKGKFAYLLKKTNNPSCFEIKVDRLWDKGLDFDLTTSLSWNKQANAASPYHLENKDCLSFQVQESSFGAYSLAEKELLFLGNHKKPDWTLVKKRQNLQELLPAFFALSQTLAPLDTLKAPTSQSKESFALIEDCLLFIEKKDRQKIKQALLNLFQGAFCDLLHPRLFDDDHQGLHPPQAIDTAISPLYLIKALYPLIRQLFIQERENAIYILPVLPTCLPFGSLKNIRLNQGKMHFRWSKKKIFSLSFYSHIQRDICFHFPKNVSQCRLYQDKKSKGKSHLCSDPIAVERGKWYHMDRFTQ